MNHVMNEASSKLKLYKTKDATILQVYMLMH